MDQEIDAPIPLELLSLVKDRAPGDVIAVRKWVKNAKASGIGEEDVLLTLTGTGWPEPFAKWCLNPASWRPAPAATVSPPKASGDDSGSVPKHPRKPDPQLQRDFFAAVQARDMNRLRALVEKSPDLVYGFGEAGNTPLHDAGWNGHAEVVEFLLAKQANPNAGNGKGLTPLHSAAARGHLQIVRMLLARLPNVDAKDGQGLTALHHAAESGSREVAELLIKGRADIEARDASGRTPLHLATIAANNPVIELLIRHKAQVNAKANNGWTPLRWAILCRNTAIAEILRRSGGNIGG